MNNFRKLDVWKKAVQLAIVIYQITENYPQEEMYALTPQIRRSTVSISSNIAEGAGRRSGKDFRRFLDIATGSCYELETQLIISENLGYISKNAFKELRISIIEIQKMIYALSESLN